jgi:hypothetical protein
VPDFDTVILKIICILLIFRMEYDKEIFITFIKLTALETGIPAVDQG